MPDATSPIQPVSPGNAPGEVVQPAQPPTPQPPPSDAASQAGQAPAPLPEDLVKIPALQAIVAGSPVAVSLHLKGADDRAEVKLVTQHKDALQEAGMAFYKSISGDIGVMYNALRVHPQDLYEADKQGKLLQIAPNFDQVNHTLEKAGIHHPILNAQAPTGAMPSATPIAPPQASAGGMVPPAPSSVIRKIATQRMLNAQPGAPTSGPAPGQGRLLNQILKGAT